jgi:neutral ceramidase
MRKIELVKKSESISWLTVPALLMIAAVSSLTFGCSSTESAEPNYLVGSGFADITGPLVDVAFTGYSQPTHIANGVHTRLSARAFIIGEIDIGEGDRHRRLVLVTTDLLNVSQEIRLSVVDNLRAKYGDLYTLDNVVISATHTHSSPGGYRHDGAYREAYFEAVVSGVAQAIEAAHEDLQPGRILLGKGDVENAGANRSAVAYEQNPEAERVRYTNDTDKEMTLLKFVRGDAVIGVLSWFAVHPTSLTFNNSLVSADHKGFAAMEMEKRFQDREDTADGFVAAFAQSNCGDVTGNLNLDNTGPGVDDYDSARVIGQRQLDTATALFDSASEALRGGLDYRFALVDFTDLEVTDEFTGSGPQRTCFPAYGYSFAGGSTEDGGGHPLFMEGLLEPDESLEALVELVLMPPPVSDALRACQAPKPILYRKSQQPSLPIGVARVGQLAIVFVPSEVTTMSGRRMRDTVQRLLGDQVTDVVIAGYSNDYAGYITTPEEYAVQQYEGGHTLFGPWTLPAFRQELDRLARALADGSPALGSEDQDDLRGMVESLPVGNEYDEPPNNGAFGEVTTPPKTSYASGDSMSVSFWTGHPDNALRLGAPYFEIQRLIDSDWSTVATEGDWSTQVRWTQASRVIPPYDPLDPFAAPPPPINEAFTVSIVWQIPDDAEPGTYRVTFYGSEKEAGSEARTFAVETRSFEISAAAP